MAKEYKTEYYSGQGKVFLYPVSASGVPQLNKMRWVGNVPKLAIGVETDKAEHKESYSGFRTTDKVITKEIKATFSATLEEFNAENLRVAFRAAKQETAAGSVADAVVANETPVVGDVFVLPHLGVSNLVLTDSKTGTPVTLEEGKHYTFDAQFSRGEWLNVEGLKTPVKAAYTHKASVTLDAMGEAAQAWGLRFEGLNTADDNTPVLIEIPKTDINPAKTLDLITEELGSLELEGTALRTNGQFVKITKLA